MARALSREVPRRVLIAAGRLPRNPKPCGHGHHAGPFRRRPDPDPSLIEAWEAIGIPCPFVNSVDCLSCGSTLALPARRSA